MVAKLRVYTDDLGLALEPRAQVFSQVWVEVVNEHLREFNYKASLAKLEFSLKMDIDAIDFEWSGLSHSMVDYVEETVDLIANIEN